MANSKIKLYITLDVFLENSNYNELGKNIKNTKLLEALRIIETDFRTLLDIIILVKDNNNQQNIKDFIEKQNLSFNYQLLFVNSINDFMKNQTNISKDITILDSDDDFLYEWEQLNGKSIKYIDDLNHKKLWDCLEIKNNYDSTEMYIKKFISYMHLYH